MRRLTTFTFLLLLFTANSYAQTYTKWYANSQQRIDTLRKGNFGLKIIDENGQPFSGDVSVRMTKHEFPFGIAFDLYEGATSFGNSYSTTSTIQATSDAEIYQSERWNALIAYALPVQQGKPYKLTLKFAEIYFGNEGSRIFDVYVEGKKFLAGYDVFKAAGGKNVAADTSIVVTSIDSIINIELISIKDNASIKGIELLPTDGSAALRINCGGNALTTANGNSYQSDQNYFDQNASTAPTDEQWAKAAMQKYFNYGVSGNSFKWSGIQSNHTTPNYTAFDNAVKWTQSIGWELRAHTLLWGGYEYTGDHEMPRWVKDLPTVKAKTDTCKMRVIREVTRYKGIVKEYDVMNEPLHATYFASQVGDSINWNCFKWARSADPDAKLFINDYNVEYNWGDAKKYRDLILKIKKMGGPVTGVGMQAHFWDGMRPNIDEFVTQINIVAEAGLPIRFTEFDTDGHNKIDQANDVLKVMKIAFSHPSVNGLIFWGLSDKGAWRELTGIFEANHQPKPAADSLLYYTKTVWATNFDTLAAGETPVSFNAYYGNYDVEVKFNNQVKTFSIPCLKTNADSTFVLYENDAQLKGPGFVEAHLLSDNSLLMQFDQPIDETSITKGNFKFFTNNALRVETITIDETNKNVLVVKLQSAIAPADYLAISYFPGTLSSVNGGHAKAFGPATVKNLTAGLLSASVINDGNTLETKFSQNILGLTDNLSSFAVMVGGKKLAVSSLAYKDTDSSTVWLSLATPVTSTGKPTLQYSGGTLKSAQGFLCQSSATITVTNLWPKVISAEVNTTGLKVEVKFGSLVKNATKNKDSFTFLVGGVASTIKAINESGADSTKLTFTLNERIMKGKKVTMAYQPGSIKRSNGNSLTAITNMTVKNSSNTVGVNALGNRSVEIFPNPTSDYVQVNTESTNYTIMLYNDLGVKVYEQIGNSESTTIDVSMLKKGFYLIQVVDNIGTSITDKLIIK